MGYDKQFIFGVRGDQYGVWNRMRKCWQFNICEDTPMLAHARLFQKIGYDAYKYRFEIRPLPKEVVKMPHDSALLIELQRKDYELKQIKKALCEAQNQIAELQKEIQTVEIIGNIHDNPEVFREVKNV